MVWLWLYLHYHMIIGMASAVRRFDVYPSARHTRSQSRDDCAIATVIAIHSSSELGSGVCR